MWQSARSWRLRIEAGSCYCSNDGVQIVYYLTDRVPFPRPLRASFFALCARARGARPGGQCGRLLAESTSALKALEQLVAHSVLSWA